MLLSQEGIMVKFYSKAKSITVVSLILGFFMTIGPANAAEELQADKIQKSNESIVLGNFITMDSKKPFAKAALVKNGVFAYIGDADEAKRLAGNEAKVLDYGDNYVYPGFLESHTHGMLAGYRAIGQADLSQVIPTDYKKYREIIKAFIAKNPGKELYLAAGWFENEEYVSKAYLDEICPDKPLIMNTGSGHSCLLNTKALEWAGVDAAYAKKYGPALVHVDKNGEPDGYICEMPAIEIVKSINVSIEEAKTYLLDWQNLMLKKGFTAVADAGAELFYSESSKAYHELELENKLKLRTYSYILMPDNPENPKVEIARAVADRAKYSGEYYNVVGVKVFLDGVVEAHTAWQVDDYADESGYHGLERFNNRDKMIALITAADAEGLSVHAHSDGSGATRFILNCIDAAEKITGNKDQRNVVAHLHFVEPDDIRKMAETNTIPAVAPLWTAKVGYDVEFGYVGKLADKSYPIKSFYDVGTNVVFHTDYPISPRLDINLSFYMAENRAIPEGILEIGGKETQLNIEEAINREQALRAMTINVAKAWRQENRMGSIEFGKLANMTVFDCDFLHDDADKLVTANVIATIIDGEEVYKNSDLKSEK